MQMKFRTEYHPQPTPIRFDPERAVLFMGSCFSANIGGNMRESFVDASVAPGGVCFNPASVSRQIELALTGGFSADDLPRTQGGRCFSWDFPTQFGGADEAECAGKCRKALDELADYLRRSALIVITFGTSWVYELATDPGRIVTNCHKQAAQMFVRRRMSSDETASLWSRTIAMIRELNGDAEFIFTVSPVRHLKDGFAGNARSKAELLLAVERICRENPGCDYFPAFEIFMDDLRDYRFYADDLVHPSQQGIEYIRELFLDTYCTPEARELLAEGAALRRRMAHRSLGTDPLAEEHFNSETLRMAAYLKARHPGLKIEV